MFVFNASRMREYFKEVEEVIGTIYNEAGERRI